MRLKKIYSNTLKIILFSIVLFAISNVCYRKYEEKLFKKEMDNLINMNLTEDSFDIPLKTHGDYQKTEKIIKTYLNDYSDKVKNILSIINDNNLKSMLSIENYTADGPAFINTATYLNDTKENFNNEINSLIELSSKQSVTSYIKKKKLSNYYEELYLKYMLGNEFKSELEKSISELKNSNENINTLIDKESAVIQFLANSTWSIKNDKIMFYKEEDVTAYNSLINDIKPNQE